VIGEVFEPASPDFHHRLLRSVGLVPLRLLLETALVIDPETAVSLAVVVAHALQTARQTGTRRRPP